MRRGRAGGRRKDVTRTMDPKDSAKDGAAEDGAAKKPDAEDGAGEAAKVGDATAPEEAAATATENATAAENENVTAAENATAAEEATPKEGEPEKLTPSEAVEEASAEAPEAAAAPSPAPKPEHLPIKGAAWGEPIARFEKGWTWLEARLLTFVLMAQIVVLVLWVILSGISSPPSTGDASGLVFRCALAAILLGAAGWAGSRKRPLEHRRLFAIGGVALGILIGLILRPAHDATGGVRLALHRGLGLDRLDAAIVEYFGNVKSWLQEGSTLTLMGGLRGVATRLTLWLALLGGSLATAAGKHIHIDVIFRFLPKRLRVPAAIINYVTAAAVCFAATWGFFDHLAIESYGSKADDAASAKISRVAHEMGEHGFLARKQIGLDLRSLPRVIAGTGYDKWMSVAAWNEWVRDAGFEDHYTPEEIKTVYVPEGGSPPPPLVLAPDGEATRGILLHDLSLVFPLGLLMIGLRFLLRAVLTLSGHIPVDPDAAHKDDIKGHDASAELGPNTTESKTPDAAAASLSASKGDG